MSASATVNMIDEIIPIFFGFFAHPSLTFFFGNPIPFLFSFPPLISEKIYLFDSKIIIFQHDFHNSFSVLYWISAIFLISQS